MNEELKNVKISVEAHRELKIYCAENNLEVNKAASSLVMEIVRLKKALSQSSQAANHQNNPQEQ